MSVMLIHMVIHLHSNAKVHVAMAYSSMLPIVLAKQTVQLECLRIQLINHAHRHAHHPIMQIIIPDHV